MKCGGCVRAVEQRLMQQPGVRQASVNLLTRTAWLELEPGLGRLGEPGARPDAEAAAPEWMAALLASLAELGFQARPRQENATPLSRRERLRQRDWWQQWRTLFVALSLVLVSTLGHAAESGAFPDRLPFTTLSSPWLHGLVATLALAFPGRMILLNGFRAALAGLPSMDTLVGLGMASAWLASAVGLLWPASGWPCFFNEPVMLLGFVLAGRFLEERARWRTGRAIEELIELQPDQALLLVDDGPPRQVRVGGLRPGDRIQVLPGDRVPVDGVVVAGESALDLSALTGEAMPETAVAGQELSAGCLNLTAPLQLEVRRSGAESAIARIVHLVEQAQARKAPIQGLADRVAGRFALAVLLLAGATFLFWWLLGARLWPHVLIVPAGSSLAMHGAHGLALHGAHGAMAAGTTITPLALGLQLAIAVLVVACPCALGLATPTAITVGCGRAARAGLLFRGGDAIEMAASLRAVLFDKTGTLTLGRPLVTAVELIAMGAASRLDAGAAAAEVDPEVGLIVQLAASLENQSRHPLAHALLQEAQRRELALLAVQDGRSVAGEGVQGRLQVPHPGLNALLVRVGKDAAVEDRPLLLLGRLGWLIEQGVVAGEQPLVRQAALESEGATVLALAAGSSLLALVTVEDQPRRDAASTLRALRQRGLRLALLSGDRAVPVRRLGERLGFEPQELAWELRPEQKLERILAARLKGPVAMVGDGINDAPALAAADLGIAIGTGTQIAQESAALVVMGERLEGVLEALRIAERTMAKVRQNLAWAFGYNLIVIPIAAGALLPAFSLRLTPPLAALLMALSSITVVVNALLLPGGSRALGKEHGAA
ncbi:cation-translocating P-type ATPase [Synechococcus sp. CBW1004]|uniref:heavy metal translocating P-type ATPase n=1 Tax=Synechococcus sp. CBW1004 TaxID=1353136 RepID=UPI0018CDF60B|nr:heavy metal translocating P-type ATPase [Synechococcus sp. CBW1004]QPN65042.1 heavy metal translocating P-type ATPase [Synechococcus sp. CBW1004]